MGKIDYHAGKVEVMLRVIGSGLIFDLMSQHNLTEDEITNAVKDISADELEEFASDNPSLVYHTNMILVYLRLIEEQLETNQTHSTTYDC